jgi:hypothetical protein
VTAVIPFVWAVAEATVWPIMPDAVLVPLVGRWVPGAVMRGYWWLTLGWGLVFGIGLWRTVVFWERRGDERT